MNIYLDNAATTCLSASMKQYLTSILALYANPSSLYSPAEKTRQIIEDTRLAAARFINAAASDIYFTGGGSASNTLAVRGYYTRQDCSILCSPIAHKSILTCVESYPDRQFLHVDHEGLIDLHDLEQRLSACPHKPFVVIDHANSELGTIQDVVQIIETVHRYGGIVYLDCTGSIPQCPVDVKALDADMIGFSAHKLGGLKGCGVLYKKKSVTLEPLIYGNQEQGLIGGTENTLGIASLGKALQEHAYASISSHNRDYVYRHVIHNIPDSYLVGAPIQSGNRLPHNLYLCFPGVDGESLLLLLDLHHIQVSTGSACNSRTRDVSAALSAVGMQEPDVHSCIRLTFSGAETPEELDYICDKLFWCVKTLRELNS